MQRTYNTNNYELEFYESIGSYTSYISCVLHLLQAVVVPFKYSSDFSTRTYKIYKTIYHWENRTNMTKELHETGSYNPFVTICVFFALSFIFQAIEYSYYKKKYYDEVLSIRYIEYAISASVMFATMGVLIGVNDLISVCLLFMSMFATNVLGLAVHFLMTEDCPGFSRYYIPLHICSWTTFAVPFVLLCLQILETSNVSPNIDTRMQMIIWATGGLMFCFGLVQIYDIMQRPDAARKHDRTIHVITVGIMYDVFSIVAKTTLAWLILSLMIEDKI